jgi:hypothetical protein
MLLPVNNPHSLLQKFLLIDLTKCIFTVVWLEKVLNEPIGLNQMELFLPPETIKQTAVINHDCYTEKAKGRGSGRWSQSENMLFKNDFLLTLMVIF